MLLTELTLRNFRVHADRTFRLGTGVTGVVGVNGAGKSSLVEAIGFLFTGETDDPRSQVIRAGTHGPAWVRGRFELHGREGVLERSLDDQRVLLEYDGRRLHKATEVRDLWQDLLQVDTHIFRHVILARQKCIPDLFSGEPAIRERAFQRIFMVPNTERLRTTIWDGYLKACPPPLPEEDAAVLDRRKGELERELAPLLDRRNLMRESVLTDDQVLSVAGYINTYRRCLEDARLRPEILAGLQRLADRQEVLLLERRELEARMPVPADLDGRINQEMVRQDRHQRRQAGLAELARLREGQDGGEVETDAWRAAQEARLGDLRVRREMLVRQAVEGRKEMAGLVGLAGSTCCPTCRRPLSGTDLSGLLGRLHAQIVAAEAELDGLSAELLREEQAWQAGERRRAGRERLAALQAALPPDIADFDPGEMARLQDLRQKERRVLDRLAEIGREEAQLRQEDAVARERLARLAAYQGNVTAEEDLRLMQEVLHAHRVRTEDLVRTDRQADVLRRELELLEERRTASGENRRRNEARQGYLNRLRQVYDVLHATEFPRRLLQTYALAVEEELRVQLVRFNLPFEVRIGDGFSLRVLREGRELPRLSGGQEMLLGLALRLALHSMFSQAFPMLVIDEGTTHLDAANREAYFECIRSLRDDRRIRQLVIIDHDPRLADVVDRLIRLEAEA